MSILNSKICKGIMVKLESKARKNKIENNIYPKFVFICGEQILNEKETVKTEEELVKLKNKRQYLISSLERNEVMVTDTRKVKNVLCVISEKMFEDNGILDTLTFEELLAEISDKIIIIVESPGTFCELGAFTVKKEYMEKLIIINDKMHKNDKSFINGGPIKKITDYNEDNLICTSYVYDQFKDDFFINDLIKKIKSKNIEVRPNKKPKQIEIKQLIYELFNIVELFMPLTIKELNYIYKKVKAFDDFDIAKREIHKINSLGKIIKIMTKMNLVFIKDDYIIINSNYTCFNALFNINRKEFNELRNQYVGCLYRNYKERIKVSYNEDITINE